MDKKIKHTENILDGTKRKTESTEDCTEFGEFICSFDKWTSPEEQKLIVERLENITKSKK